MYITEKYEPEKNFIQIVISNDKVWFSYISYLKLEIEVYFVNTF